MKKLENIKDVCAPLAVKIASGLPDEKVIEIFISQGFTCDDLMLYAKKAGLRLRGIKFKKMQLRRFIKRFPEGMFILVTHNHFFVLDNGKVNDPHWGSDGLYRIIVKAWCVQNSNLNQKSIL